jgi:Cys-tRNA(Pro)/Cys-tRNA(Cys) deacylase
MSIYSSLFTWVPFQDTILCMTTNTAVTEALDALEIPYRLHIHQNPLRSLEQAAQERGLEPTQIVRSLLFRCEHETYVLVLIAGSKKVNWTKLRRHLGVSRITTATPEQVLEITGYPPGTVSPFGLASPLRILADHGITDHEEISLGAGIPNAGILLARDDLLKALNLEMGDFVD